MNYRLDQDYLRYLSSLSGDEFQEEIEKLAGDSFLDFQPVLANPGDGGCDGIYSDFSSYICCYGLDLKKSDLNKNKIITKIKRKFKDDLNRLLELKVKGRGDRQVYSFAKNEILKDIVPEGKKIKAIRLVVNYNENSLIKYFNELFTDLKSNSKLNFVDKDCAVVLVCLGKIGTMFNITENALVRLKYRLVEEAVQLALDFDINRNNENETVRKSKSKFDKKFNILRDNHCSNSEEKEEVEKMRKEYLANWYRYIQFMTEVEKNNPVLFKKISDENAKIAKDGKRLFLGNKKLPLDKIEHFSEAIERKWQNIFDNTNSEKQGELQEFDLAHFVGACPLEWK